MRKNANVILAMTMVTLMGIMVVYTSYQLAINSKIVKLEQSNIQKNLNKESQENVISEVLKSKLQGQTYYDKIQLQNDLQTRFNEMSYPTSTIEIIDLGGIPDTIIIDGISNKINGLTKSSSFSTTNMIIE